MFWSVFGPKGGVGTSVCAAALALELSIVAEGVPVLLVDFGGDQADILGVDAHDSPGVVDWIESGDAVGVDALENVLLEVTPTLQLLPRGRGPLPTRSGNVDPGRCLALVQGLRDRWRFVVADMGVPGTDPAGPRALMIAASDRSTCVVRDCYLALRHVAELPVVADEVIELVEPGRALSTVDVEAVVGHPIAARIRVDPTVARVVDAGLLSSRRPRRLRRAMGGLISEVYGLPPIGARR